MNDNRIASVHLFSNCVIEYKPLKLLMIMLLLIDRKKVIRIERNKLLHFEIIKLSLHLTNICLHDLAICRFLMILLIRECLKCSNV